MIPKSLSSDLDASLRKRSGSNNKLNAELKLKSFRFSSCSGAQRPRLAHSIGEQNDQRQYQRQAHEALGGNVCSKF